MSAVKSSSKSSSSYPGVYRHSSVRIDEKKHKVSIGHGSVLHPYVTIRAKGGPIVIGDYCIIEDDCLIKNDLPPQPDGTPSTMRIGNYCVLSIRSEVLSRSVGDNVKVNPYGVINTGSCIGNGCVIGSGAIVPEFLSIPPYTVVYSDQNLWRTRHFDKENEESEVIHLSRWYRKNLS